ncbi:MAG: efflux RND transporter permease subunit [Desulfurella sp.]
MTDKLNIAGKLAKSFLESKITLLIMIAVSIFGILAIYQTPRMYNPEIVVPSATIIIQRPGFNAQEMNNQVVKPLEAIVAAISGVDHTYGYAQDNIGMVTVQFYVGQDEEKSLLKLYNQIMRNMDRMPPGTLQPLVKSISINDVPIETITLSSKTLPQEKLRSVALRLVEQLRSVPNVGLTNIYGGFPKSIVVWINPQKLSSYGISVNQLINTIGASNVNFSAGSILTDNKNIPIKIESKLTNTEDVGNIVIGAKDGKPIFLKDVADIVEGPAHTYTNSIFYDGLAAKKNINLPQSAVTIALAKRAGSNAVVVANQIKEKLNRFEKEALPENINVTITKNDGQKANNAVNTLIEHLGISILVVVVILLFFLGYKEAGIVTVTIPLIVFVVLGIGWLIGQSINRITLFALILSLGLLVDAAIVVIENIHRHISCCPVKDFKESLILATNEIGNPTNIATVAVILAFVPMAFVGGMMGPFMRPIPINVPIAMVTSLLISYIVVPWASNIFLKKEVYSSKAKEHKNFLHKAYVKTITPLITSRVKRNIFLGIVLVALFISLLLPAWQFVRPQGLNGPLSTFGVGVKMLPNDNTNTFLIEVDAKDGSSIAFTQKITQAVCDKLAKNPYITNYQVFLGETAPPDFAALVRNDSFRKASNLAQIRVNLISKQKRNKTSHQIAQAVYKQIEPLEKQYEGTRIKLFEEPPGPPVQAQVLAELYGPDYNVARLSAHYIKQDFKKIYGISNVDDSVGQNVVEYKIILDKKKIALMGLNDYAVASQINALVNGLDVTSLHSNSAQEPHNIIIKLKKSDRSSLTQIMDLQITLPNSQSVPLSSIAHVEKTLANKPIFSKDQHNVVYIEGDLLRSSPIYAVLTLNNWLDNHRLPNGVKLTTANLGLNQSQPHDISHYQILWGGEMRLTLDVFRDLGGAFIVALLFIYLILVAYYKSFMMPFIIMIPIPLTLIGVFWGHWLLNQYFSATSMIGVIALAGIVVRNSLLLIDFMLDYMSKGNSLEDSLIEAGAVRFRPILLTALAIVFGSAIMITDPVFGGLAISLVFGTFISTALTLIVIPLIYYIWQIRFVKKFNKA